MPPTASAVPPARHWNDTLTGMRGFAAVWVFAFHLIVTAGLRPLAVPGTDWTYDWFIRKGWMGVLVFYTLAGFLLARPYAQGRGDTSWADLARYLGRRCWRVLPAFWVQLVILAGVAWWLGRPAGWLDLLLQAGMAHNLIPSAQGLLNGVWWTLPVEFDFYLLLPLLMWALMRLPVGQAWRALGLLLAAVALEWAWRHGVMARFPPGVSEAKVSLVGQLPGTFSTFGAGVAAALVCRLPWRRAYDALLFWVGLALLAGAAYGVEYGLEKYWSGHPAYYLAQPAAGLGTALLILAAARGAASARIVFGNRAMVWLGMISYSLYLWHFPALRLTGAALDALVYQGDRLIPYMALGIPLALALSALSYRYVERPGLIMMARLGRRSPPQAMGEAALGESTQQIPTFR